MSALLLIVVGTVFTVSMVSVYRRAQCTTTGDIWYLNDMIVEGPDQWPNSWLVTSAVDHKQYTIVLCPPSPLKLRAGNYIEWMHPEYRDGCLDVSGEHSDFKVD